MRPVAPGLPFRNGALGHLVPACGREMFEPGTKEGPGAVGKPGVSVILSCSFSRRLMLANACWDSYFRQLCCSRHQYGRSCQSHRKFCNWAGASVLSLRCFITCPLWIWRSYGKSPCLI
jgi:hypothetical protein